MLLVRILHVVCEGTFKVRGFVYTVGEGTFTC